MPVKTVVVKRDSSGARHSASKPLGDLKRLGAADANDRDASASRSRRNSRDGIPETHFAFLKKRRISSGVLHTASRS